MALGGVCAGCPGQGLFHRVVGGGGWDGRGGEIRCGEGGVRMVMNGELGELSEY